MMFSLKTRPTDRTTRRRIRNPRYAPEFLEGRLSPSAFYLPADYQPAVVANPTPPTPTPLPPPPNDPWSPAGSQPHPARWPGLGRLTRPLDRDCPGCFVV